MQTVVDVYFRHTKVGELQNKQRMACNVAVNCLNVSLAHYQHINLISTTDRFVSIITKHKTRINGFPSEIRNTYYLDKNLEYCFSNYSSPTLTYEVQTTPKVILIYCLMFLTQLPNLTCVQTDEKVEP
jgi:hypothetical protein